MSENFIENEFKQLSKQTQITNEQESSMIKLMDDCWDRYLDSEYINANLIPAIDNERPHILAQAPKKETIFDFFLMVAQQKEFSLIVCLNPEDYLNFAEGTYEKKFFHKSGDDHAMVITTDKSNKQPVSIGYRKESICNYYCFELYEEHYGIRKHIKRICVLQYLYWNKCGVPKNKKLFYQFIKEITKKMKLFPETCPIIHCKAGFGRSGTLSCILRMVQWCQINKTKCKFDPKDLVLHTRKFQKFAVQTKNEYKLIYDIFSWD